MKNSPVSAPAGRILRHGKRADEVTAEAIEVRARELAVIDGRSASAITDDDRRRSREELLGLNLPDTTLAEDEAAGRVTRDPSEPTANPGHQTPMRNEPEDQEVMERLALEGVEEAQHDQMLAARRRERDERRES